MRSASPAFVLLLAFTLLAGCAKPQSIAPLSSSTTSSTASSKPTPIPTAEPNLHAVPVNVDFTTPGDTVDGVDCTTTPGTCILIAHETVYPVNNDTFNGTILDAGRAHAANDGGLAGNGTLVFTGSIVGCLGSGTITWDYVLKTAPMPVPRTDTFVIHGWDNVTNQASFTGFKQVADGRPTGNNEPILVGEYYINPAGTAVGTLRGTLWCE